MAGHKLTREIWKAIPGHKGYEASNLGRVRSLDKRIRLRNRWANYEWRRYRGRILKQVTTPGGYLRVKLGHHFNGADVHTLVARAFLGPRPERFVVSHSDDNGYNNNLLNLSYQTYSQNYEDAVRNGSIRRGERHYRARLTEQEVRAIRKSNESLASLAFLYGVSQTAVHNAKSGRNWAWLK
jgi:hypothetical protein